VELDGRTVSVGYRFGYQGSEKDNEFKGNGNSYTTEFRQLDPRLGRWLSVDPKSDHQNQIDRSSYTSNWENPIIYNDQDGQCPFCPWLDAAIDVGFVVYDTGVLIYEQTTTGETSGENWAALAADVTSILVPMSVGSGQAVKTGLKTTDKVQDAEKVLSTKSAIKKETAEQVSKKTLTYEDRMANLKKMSYSKNADGKWSSINYRNNLKKKTGKLGDGYDAHHVYLKSKDDWFKGAGIDINDPDNLVWRNKQSHSGTGNVSYKHRKEWEQFIKDNPDPSKFNSEKGREILKKRAMEIEKKVWGNYGEVPNK
jgi:RHS repeat-associated protein